MAKKLRILVVCPTDWERTAIADQDLQEQYEFVLCCEELYKPIKLWTALRFDVERYLNAVAATHRKNRIDGVLSTGDYPGCIFGAFISEQLGLRAPRARDIVMLSHKYYSRVLQQRLVPEATPHFEVFDPRSRRMPKTLQYPFFVKPVRGTMSIRAQMVHNRAQLHTARTLSWRERFRSFVLLKPFQQLLRSYISDPVPAHAFIAEAPLCGHQVTVDGFTQSGRATVMGIVDSIMYPGTISFRLFEYPSSLSDDVQARMSQIAVRLMEGVGFDNSCFNIEMFYDSAKDTISIIEINPRMSYQFSDLFARVDGLSSFAVQLALATGKTISWPRGQGRDRAAASFVLRRFTDARVLAMPTRQHLDDIERRFPGTQVKLLCVKDQWLSAQPQDVGSFRYCIVNMAAPSKEELHARFSQVERLLPFSFDPPGGWPEI